MLFAIAHLFNILTSQPHPCFSFCASDTRWLFKGWCSPAFNCWNLGLEFCALGKVSSKKEGFQWSLPSFLHIHILWSSSQSPNNSNRRRVEKRQKLGKSWSRAARDEEWSNMRLHPGGRWAGREESHSLALGAEIRFPIYLLTPSVGACSAMSGSSVLQESGWSHSLKMENELFPKAKCSMESLLSPSKCCSV